MDTANIDLSWPIARLADTEPIDTPTTKSKKVICAIIFLPINLAETNTKEYANKVRKIVFIKISFIYFPPIALSLELFYFPVT
jgi:hypothetical protein